MPDSKPTYPPEAQSLTYMSFSRLPNVQLESGFIIRQRCNLTESLPLRTFLQAPKRFPTRPKEAGFYHCLTSSLPPALQIPTEMEILALFNKPKSHQKCRQYYPVSIPLRVSKNGQTVSGLDANWLEHMSDHFRKGGMLVNAVFYLGMVNGMEVTNLGRPSPTLLLFSS